jgi:hypothetical protein
MTEPEITAHSANQRMLGAASGAEALGRGPGPREDRSVHTTIPRRVGAMGHDDRNLEPDLTSARRYP